MANVPTIEAAEPVLNARNIGSHKSRSCKISETRTTVGRAPSLREMRAIHRACPRRYGGCGPTVRAARARVLQACAVPVPNCATCPGKRRSWWKTQLAIVPFCVGPRKHRPYVEYEVSDRRPCRRARVRPLHEDLG